jgi:hypothetical protein
MIAEFERGRDICKRINEVRVGVEGSGFRVEG